MTAPRSDRTWTAVLAECALDRARPVLANLLPRPFARVNLSRALAATGLVPDRDMGFADPLRPALEAALGSEAGPVLDALARLPWGSDEAPAAAFWREMFRDLHGPARPDLPPAEAARFAAFLDVYRGRAEAGPQDPAWLRAVGEATADFRDLLALVRAGRGQALSPLDRSILARFGWNDAGPVPPLTGLVDAAALLRCRAAWAEVAPLFDAASCAAIERAAGALLQGRRAAALADLPADAARFSLPPEALGAALYPVREVVPLAALLAERG